MSENQTGAEGRLARIETMLAGLIESFGQIRGEYERRFSNIEKRQQESDESRQLNWPVVLAGIGVLLTVVTVGAGLTGSYFGGQMAVEKAERTGNEQLAAFQLTQIQKSISENETRGITNSESVGEIGKQLNEVETQFRGEADAESGERADNQRMVQLIYKKVFGEDLPAKIPYLRGTNR